MFEKWVKWSRLALRINSSQPALTPSSCRDHSTSNGEAAILTSIWLVSSFRDMGSSPPSFSSHSLGRKGGSRNEQSLIFSFYGEDKKLLHLCLLLSEPNTSEQVQWKLPKPRCNNKARSNTKKCHNSMREFSPFREIMGFPNA